MKPPRDLFRCRAKARRLRRERALGIAAPTRAERHTWTRVLLDMLG